MCMCMFFIFRNEVQGTDENKKINDQLKELNDEKAEIQAKLQKK